MNNSKDKIWNMECLCSYPDCGALLMVESEDVEIKVGKNLSFYYTFRCPCCNIESRILSNYLPLKVKIYALKKFRINIKKGVSFYEGTNV